MVCKHHGFPRSLISDRDALFLSSFWRELFKLSGTKLRMSTAYHPQSDGQTEVVNRVLEQYLRSFVHHKPHHWSRFLSLAEWSYNTTVHTSTGYTPFEVTYGKAPPSLIDYVRWTSPIDAVDSMLTDRTELHNTLLRRLRKAQEFMTTSANKHRRDLQFSVGDWAYVKLRPYRQKSVAPAYSKLSKRYYGPYQVIERIGSVAYRLQLPPSSRIHPVFHVSLLKRHQGPLSLTSAALPPSSVEHHPLVTPLAFLDWQWDTSVTPAARKVLVQWAGLPPENASWESWSDVKHTFNLEDEVPFEGEGDDSNIQITEHIETAAVPNYTTDNKEEFTAMNSRSKRDTHRPKYLADYV